MTIFISSTCYDLKDLRAELESFLHNKGYSLLLSDRANFPTPTGVHRHDVCIQNVGACDMFILVIDSRYGAPYYKDPNISITWAELREAINTKKEIIAFVRQEVFNERQSCRHNQKKGNPYDPFFVDNIKTFDLIDEVQQHSNGIWIQPFESSIQVKEKLKNIHETKHSPFNKEEPGLDISSSKIPLTAVSGSTASFLMQQYNLDDKETVDAETLESAINKIPENYGTWGEILGFESIPGSNDYYSFFPLRHSGDEGEMIIGVYPTALGRSVRNELQGVLKKIKNEENATTFFTETVKRKPILCRSCEFDNRSYIIGIYEKVSQYHGKTQHLCVLNYFANTWQVYHDEQLDEHECYPEISDNSEIIIHNKKIFFYFERLIQEIGTAFQGMGVAEFSVFDFERKMINKLLYQGTYRNGAIEGTFNFDLLEKNTNSQIYEYILEQEASKSKYVYRTPQDYDLDNPENCIEKWNVENPDFYSNEIGRVTFSLYDQNILWNRADFESLGAYKEKTDHVENKKYIVFYYFAGPILAVRKSDNKNFVVLVPASMGAGGTWGLRSINHVEFQSSDMIFAKNDFESYEIDLLKGDYIRKSIDT